MIYGNRIKHLRDRNYIKSIQLAEVIDKSKSLYSEYENEKKTIPTKHLNTISNYLNVSFDYLFGFNDELQYKNNNLSATLNKKEIGSNLKNIRKQYKLTQEELGKVVGVKYSTIAGYESGRYLVSVPVLYKICKKYDISADCLLGKINNN
jgi:transcriptional regulator with XRE-family HTH domain